MFSMKTADRILHVGFGLIAILCLFGPRTPVGLAGNLGLLAAVGPLCFLIGRYPRRIKLYKQRKLIESQPVQTVTAEKISSGPADTGRTASEYVADGFSHKIGGGWDLYEHGHFARRPVYDGSRAAYRVIENGRTLVMRSLPKDFYLQEPAIPADLGTFEVRYVTCGGVHYWLSETRISP